MENEDLPREILRNCGAGWDLDQSELSIAIEYVRWLEDQVQSLGGTLDHYREMWNDVEVDMPDDDQWVYVYAPGRVPADDILNYNDPDWSEDQVLDQELYNPDVTIALLDYLNRWKTLGGHTIGGVTHWRPIVPPRFG